MSPQQFLVEIQSFDRAAVRRAKAAVLAGGWPPQTGPELRRFYIIVWLLLRGSLQF